MTNNKNKSPNKKPVSRRKFLSLAGQSTVVALASGVPYFSSSTISAALTTEVLSAGNLSWSGYQNSIIIDGLSGAFDLGSMELKQTDLDVFKRSGINAVNMTVPYPGDDFEEANRKISETKNLIKKYSDYFYLITNAADILKAKANNQIGIIIGFQSTEMFTNDLNRITHFAKAGARIMQMSYNGQSQFGDGGLVKENKGLSSLGIQALDVMEKNSVLVDLSHSGQKTVSDAIKFSKVPLHISHTGCNAIYQHPRNNDDKELRAVADKGGVVGIYLMPFLEGGDGEITAESFLRHIDHAINICGEDHVSIGSDQGIIPVNDSPEYREMIRKDVKRRIAAGISAPGETPNRPPFIPQLNSERRMEWIAAYMHKRGYNNSVIEKVVGGNLMRLYQSIWN